MGKQGSRTRTGAPVIKELITNTNIYNESGNKEP